MRLFCLFFIRNAGITIYAGAHATQGLGNEEHYNTDFSGLSFAMRQSLWAMALGPLGLMHFLIDRKELTALQVVIHEID